MFRLTYEIQIGTLILRSASSALVSDVEISNSIESQTANCTIRLPRNVNLRRDEIERYIKTGDRVTVKLGYDWNLKTEFLGYLRHIKPTTPLTLECEDEMYKFKQTNFARTYADVSLSQLIRDLGWTGRTSLIETRLGKLRIGKTTAAKVLDKIREDYHLRFFFRIRDGEPELVAANVYDSSVSQAFKFQQDIINDDLAFERGYELKIAVKVIHHTGKGKPETVEIGDSGGDTRTLHYYNTPDFKRIAESELTRLRYNGYRGMLTTFGYRTLQPGQIAALTDPRYPERGGSYFVDDVKLSFGQSGYRAAYKLGPKAS